MLNSLVNAISRIWAIWLLESEQWAVKDGSKETQKAMKLLCKALQPYVRASSVHVLNIMDYAPGDPATSKVNMAMRAMCSQTVTIDHVEVPNFDTVAAGFNAMCLLKQPHSHFPGLTLGYINVAPIYNADQVGNGEHKFLLLLLDNGVLVFAPHAGANIHYLLPHVVAMYEFDFESEALLHPQGHKGQFRSWWWFTQVIGRLLKGDLSKIVGAWLKLSYVGSFSGGPGYINLPQNPETQCAAIDNYGNLRFTMTADDVIAKGWKPDDLIQILVDGTSGAVGIYSPTTNQPGETICIRSGSNLISSAKSGIIEYLDGFVIGGSAHQVIGSPCLKDVVITLQKV
jgi:hypothetical protein